MVRCRIAADKACRSTALLVIDTRADVTPGALCMPALRDVSGFPLAQASNCTSDETPCIERLLVLTEQTTQADVSPDLDRLRAAAACFAIDDPP